MALASITAHGLLLVALDAWGVGQRASPGFETRDARAAKASLARSPTPSCEADAALATFARLAYCATPLGEQTPCMDQALRDFRAARLTCNAIAFPTDVSLIEPTALDRIEPEPLLELLDPLEQERFEAAQAQAIEDKFQAEQKKLEKPPERAKQVVEITEPNGEEEPENAQYLSEYNSRVEKQTVARGSTEEMAARPKSKVLKVKEQPREAAIKEIPDKPSRAADPDKPEGPGKLSMRGKPGPEQNKQTALEQAKSGSLSGKEGPASENGIVASRGDAPFSEEKKDAQEAGGGGSEGGGGRPLVPNLRPTQDILERAAGGGSVDKLDNVENGDTTALNSKRWKYATFFNRMKRRVAQNWHPAEVYIRRDPNGNVYGTRDRITFVHVSLDPSGSISRIHILKSSGVDFLDDEAVRAFRAAEPFPNPPQGLVDKRSQLIKFSFTFHFEIGKPGAWKVFRNQ